MATLQVKHLPEELHSALKERAVAEHITLSELITRMIRRELAVPSPADWVAAVQERRPPRADDLDVLPALDEARDEFDRQ